MEYRGEETIGGITGQEFDQKELLQNDEGGWDVHGVEESQRGMIRRLLT